MTDQPTNPTVSEAQIERALTEGTTTNVAGPQSAEAQNEAQAAAERYASEDKPDLKQGMRNVLDAKKQVGLSDRQPKDFDLDLDSLHSLRVRLGGQVWEAVEPTIEVNKELTKALPKIEGDDAEAAFAALSSIYPQVARVLRDPDSGFPPSQEFVEKYLSGRNFGRLMERLNEDAQEGNR